MNAPCTSTHPRRRASISRAARSTSGRSTCSTTARRRSTRRSACARAAASGRGPTARIVIVSEDTGQRVEADALERAARTAPSCGCSAGCSTTSRSEGLELRTRSDSPFGAGIAGSSALNIAVCGALKAWTERPLPDDAAAPDRDERRGAGDRRADRRAGLSAGALRRRLGGGARRRRRPPRGARQSIRPSCEPRLVLAYTGATRNSGINNWDVTKRHIDGDREVQRRFARIRDIAVAMRAALERRRLAGGRPARSPPNGTTASISPPASRRRRSTPCWPRRASAGAIGGKVCGAGGGGCLFCLGAPDDVPAIRQALADRRRARARLHHRAGWPASRDAASTA